LYVGGVDTSIGGKLFGTSMHGEDIAEKDADSLPGFLREFCLQTAPWYYLNRHTRERVEHTRESSAAFFSGGVKTHVDHSGRVTIREGERVIQDGDDILVPALWRTERSAIAYSRAGYKDRSWQLPPDWKGVAEVRTAEITMSGLRPAAALPVRDGRIRLTIAADHALQLPPPGKP
jgi:hypothetical protein